MLNWLFGSRPAPSPPPPIPATPKQIRYAQRLGITIPEGADLATLSRLIGDAEKHDPSQKAKRDKAKERVRVQNYGKEQIDEEKRWQAHVDAEKWMLVVFTRGKARVAEVVRINSADITSNGSIELFCEVMKLEKDRDIGLHVSVGRDFAINVDKIDWHEIVDEVEIDDIQQFQRYIERAKSRL